VGKIRVRGEVKLVPDGTGVTAVNRLELEDYLKGVVPGEIGKKLSKDKLEAVKAAKRLEVNDAYNAAAASLAKY
jgi:peptidoglycan hydrolase-like amidase